MSEEYFVLQDPVKREPNSYYFHIPKCKNIVGGQIPQIPPTASSIKSGLLEWIIPNNQFNQNHISQHYSHFKILRAGEEQEFVGVEKMANMPEPMQKNVALVQENPEVVPTAKPVYDASVANTTAVQNITNPDLKPLNEAPVEEAPLRESNVLNAPLVQPKGAINEIPNDLMPDINEETSAVKKLSGVQVKQLKIEVSNKLTELGVAIPKNSSLSALQALLKLKGAKKV